MNARQKFFSSGIYHVVVSEPPISNVDSDNFSPLSQDEVSVICPLNEHGYVSDVLGRALSSDVTSLQQQQLLSMLDDNGTGSNNLNVPDDVKLNLCKLRSCQSPSEMKQYINALSAWCDANNVSLIENETNTNENEINANENETNTNVPVS